MINVRVLNSNNIVTLDSEGKLPIKSSQGYMFYNTNELLCVAVGACAGRHIVIYGTQNKLDLATFEFIGVTMDDDVIEIHLYHPENFDPKDLINILENCEVSKKIAMPIKVIAKANLASDEELTKRSKIKGCCGGEQ